MCLSRFLFPESTSQRNFSEVPEMKLHLLSLTPISNLRNFLCQVDLRHEDRVAGVAAPRLKIWLENTPILFGKTGTFETSKILNAPGLFSNFGKGTLFPVTENVIRA